MPSRSTATVRSETDAAITAAVHLTVMDAGMVAAIRELASLIDGSIIGGVVGVKGMSGGSDNLFTSYLKMSESLGLTPLGRSKLPDQKTAVIGGTLAKLRAVKSP